MNVVTLKHTEIGTERLILNYPLLGSLQDES